MAPIADRFLLLRGDGNFFSIRLNGDQKQMSFEPLRLRAPVNTGEFEEAIEEIGRNQGRLISNTHRFRASGLLVISSSFTIFGSATRSVSFRGFPFWKQTPDRFSHRLFQA
ncbi:MAG: hypothetical protein JRG80_07330 [Deltaproteobacteria bacterium]|nr:hypothetical protein [Deltaproteobacteria bacterium]